MICPQCSATCIVPCQTGLRCNQCGLQFGVEPQPKGLDYGSTPGPVLRHFVMSNGKFPPYDMKGKRDPVVSIIMPTFRREHTIGRAVESVVKQTFKSWELIIVDNEPNHQYQPHWDKRVKCVRYSKRLGASFARNHGLLWAIGELICFLDDDDIINENYLMLMTAPFNDNKVNLVTCCVEFDIGERVRNIFCTPSTMIRKSVSKLATWNPVFGHDEMFYESIYNQLPADSLVRLPQVLVQAFTTESGGLREGSC